jgi:hypothetical protein
MNMKETVNEYRFIEGFRECNREDNFSPAFNDAYGKDYEDFDELEEDGICFFLRFDVHDYFAEGASIMKPHVEEHIIVEDF